MLYKPPVVPGNLQTAIFKANEVLGRTEVDADVSLWNLKQAILGQAKLGAGKLLLGHDTFETLCCMALLADDKGQFRGTDAQLAKAVGWLQPQVETLLNRIGSLSKCLLAGDANSPERLAEMQKQKLDEWLNLEDCQFLSWLMDRPWS